MTTNEKREPSTIGWLVVKELNGKLPESVPPFTALWLANRITEAVNAARTASDAAMTLAYDVGFQASGEGWNGEYPGDAWGTQTYGNQREKDLAELRKRIDRADPSP